jgi:hypothetical protein
VVFYTIIMLKRVIIDYYHSTSEIFKNSKIIF